MTGANQPMYFEDMTTYSYIRSLGGFRTWLKWARGFQTLNIGWLDRNHPFPIQVPEEWLLNALFECCGRFATNVTKGVHRCDLCSGPQQFATLLHVERFGRSIYLGSAEIHIQAGKTVFAAPNLIYHYVAIHHYLPPKDFVLALRNIDSKMEKVMDQYSPMGVSRRRDAIQGPPNCAPDSHFPPPQRRLP
jgi:hypothetical protein